MPENVRLRDGWPSSTAGGSKDNVLKDSSPDKVHVLQSDMIAETGQSFEAEVGFPGRRVRNWCVYENSRNKRISING